jgi:hypothetical protein
LKVQCSDSSSSASPNVACGKSCKQQELVPHHSSWDIASHSNYPESSPISYKGVLLEQFRGLLNPSTVEEEISITGGSICSVSDYLFQLRDFESAFDEITSSSVLKADLPTGYKKAAHAFIANFMFFIYLILLVFDRIRDACLSISNRVGSETSTS